VNAEAAYHHRDLATGEPHQDPGKAQRRHLAATDEIVASPQEDGGTEQHPGQGQEKELSNRGTNGGARMPASMPDATPTSRSG